MLRGTVYVSTDIAVVLAKPFIIGGSIIDNILLGRPLDQDRLQQVIDQCALADDLRQLAHAEHTLVGERGVTLGGQQQRLAVARALYGRPRLLIADDPLSAVDAKTQRTLLQTFTAFAKDGGGALLCSLNQPHTRRRLRPRAACRRRYAGTRAGIYREGGADAGPAKVGRVRQRARDF